jgi:hypothetical protein
MDSVTPSWSMTQACAVARTAEASTLIGQQTPMFGYDITLGSR